jgi:hypothetical protein
MPQVGGHLIVAEKVMAKLNNPPYLQSNRNAYNLGAIGPDMPFFLFDKIGQIEVLNTILDVYTTIKQIKDVLDQTTAAILDPATDLANWFTGNLLQSVKDLVSLSFTSFMNLAILTLLPGSTETVANPFADVSYPGVPSGPTITVQAADVSLLLRFFGHPFSYDKDPGGMVFREAELPGVYDRWWWTDVLHYRRTAPFAKRLVDNAGADPLLRAYATGYWTHIGTDVTGHPYVNAVVGGPYREHVIRHMVQENIIDAWLWDHYKNEDIVNAALHTQVDVGGDLGSILGLLLRTMENVYTQPDGPQANLPAIKPTYYPGSTPSENDLERAYRTMLLYLELSTDCGVTPPIPPPGSMDEVFQEVWNDITRSVEEIGESIGSLPWWLWFLAPFLLAMRALNVLIKLITLPEATLVRLATLSPRWAIYMAQVELYEYIMQARFALALSGFGKPSREDLIRPFCLLATNNNPHRAGVQKAFEYPSHQVPRTTQAFWLHDPLEFPQNLLTPAAECSPYPPYADPSIFVDGPSYPAAQDGAVQAFANAFSPAATVDIEHATIQGPQFGNAVEFSHRLIQGLYPPADFDLDADFGYGFLGWDGPPPVYVK